MKRGLFSKAVVLGLAVSMLLVTPAYAKVGPEDYYDTYQSKTKYKVGDDIDPGLYVAFNKSDNKNASITIKRNSDTIWSDTFWYNYIVDLHDGDVVNTVGSYLVEYDEAKDNIVSCEDGFFLVGDQVQPGTYDIEFVRSNDDTSYVRVWSALVYADQDDYKDYQESKNVSRGGSAEVELKDGYYIQLSGCRLVQQRDK